MMVKLSIANRPPSSYEQTSMWMMVSSRLRHLGSSHLAKSARAGLKLHKIMSNKREVLEAFPIEELAESVKESDLKVDPLPLERVLDRSDIVCGK